VIDGTDRKKAGAGVMANFAHIEQDLERNSLVLLRSDIAVALTLTKIASNATKDSDRRIRNQASARRAYDDIRRLMRRLRLGEEQKNEMNDKLEVLKSALRKLGEQF
jgi:hypothetical protein